MRPDDQQGTKKKRILVIFFLQGIYPKNPIEHPSFLRVARLGGLWGERHNPSG
jgi:hypothetical protein